MPGGRAGHGLPHHRCRPQRAQHVPGTRCRTAVAGRGRWRAHEVVPRANGVRPGCLRARPGPGQDLLQRVQALPVARRTGRSGGQGQVGTPRAREEPSCASCAYPEQPTSPCSPPSTRPDRTVSTTRTCRVPVMARTWYDPASLHVDDHCPTARPAVLSDGHRGCHVEPRRPEPQPGRRSGAPSEENGARHRRPPRRAGVLEMPETIRRRPLRLRGTPPHEVTSNARHHAPAPGPFPPSAAATTCG